VGWRDSAGDRCGCSPGFVGEKMQFPANAFVPDECLNACECFFL